MEIKEPAAIRECRTFAATSVARISTGARASLVEKVKEMTQKHKVVVFAKSWCPYCAEVRIGNFLNQQ